ncbi:hypothetical protein [Stenotrophomonas sp. Iso1]|uniref:hypothetical protein n=1 Tax=Stenotrophomonas sp. Iso1 TaxID=2977283 RepID=UPI0022B7BF0C|nr:hypothetical protein [Stenotrophomonas sp. Iso1]
MNLLKIKSGTGRSKAFAVLTAIIILCIASNPELATFVPVLDALGLDVLVYLVSAQLSVVFGSMILPYARHLYRRWGKRIIKHLPHIAFSVSGGYLRQLALHATIGGTMSAVFLPNTTLKP